VILGCPIDRAPLVRVGPTWKCDAGHSYDVAREGYVNLLPPGKPSRKKAGDDKESIAARRRFLGAGYYAPLAEAVAATVAKHGPATVLDVGCGEGYYTAHLRGSEVVGIDISAPGIRAAARAYPSATFAVGNALGLPVVAGSCDAVVSVFAPVDPDEFARVVSPDGVAVIAIPGAAHLEGVRALLYETPRPHDEALPLELDHRFELVSVDRVGATITLPDNDTLRDLLTMTPYRFAVPPEIVARAAAASTPLTTAIAFLVGVFRLR
jgi:23S rRNA (guanine745-N1)-methyltransferase